MSNDVRRVLLVLGTSGGGVGRHVRAVAAGLVGRGVAVDVAAPRSTLDAFALGSIGAVPHEVPIADRPKPPADARAVARLRRLARRADVVHAHGVRAGALAVLAVRSLPHRPAVVVTLHNAPPTAGGPARVYRLLEGIVTRGGDAVLGVSGDLVERARQRGARDVRRALVPSPAGAPASRDAAAVRAELGVPQGASLLVTVARLAPQKGLPLLADAVAHLAATRPDLPLIAVVAGEGPLEAELTADAAARGLPLRLLGRRADVADLLAAADVSVLPSVWEGQPLVVQEALRAGAPLVATDVGGTGEVVGDGAVLVPYGDPAVLAAAVARLLDDPAGRAALRSRALARAARLPTDDDAVAQLMDVYTRTARRSGGRAGTA